jgi:hypothetical protein
MANHQDMSKVLCRHSWSQLEDWVAMLDELADLSDDEIVEIQRMAAIDDQRIAVD